MSYASIANLYRPEGQTILLFRECYAMEKLHGTSTHVSWRQGKVWFSPGGESQVRFAALFDEPALTAVFERFGHQALVVYGEAYGGSCQKQAWRYGPTLKFAAFEVQIGDVWLSVPEAADVAGKLGLEFVHYVRCSTDLAVLDAERDAPSEQAKRNGVEGDKPREGVVLRPLVELRYGTDRIVAKHKRDDERETATPRKVVDPSQLEVLTNASAIATEWCTSTRLQHVLDKLPQGIGIEKTGDVIRAMTEDVLREGAGEFVDTKEARQAIGKRAGELFRTHVRRIDVK
jgi:hypothetical protein